MSQKISVESFDPKRVDEDAVRGFDFTDQLASGETLVSAATWVVTTARGTDALPQNILSGAPTISGAIVSQKIVDGGPLVTYLLQCGVTTSLGQVLHGLGYLTVTNLTKPA